MAYYEKIVNDFCIFSIHLCHVSVSSVSQYGDKDSKVKSQTEIGIKLNIQNIWAYLPLWDCHAVRQLEALWKCSDTTEIFILQFQKIRNKEKGQSFWSACITNLRCYNFELIEDTQMCRSIGLYVWSWASCFIIDRNRIAHTVIHFNGFLLKSGIDWLENNLLSTGSPDLQNYSFCLIYIRKVASIPLGICVTKWVNFRYRKNTDTLELPIYTLEMKAFSNV